MAAILRRGNTGACWAVLAVQAGVVVLEWLAGGAWHPGVFGDGNHGWRPLPLRSACTFAGMAPTFVASPPNLRKRKEGFRKLGEGKPAPDIPAVRCPVRTEAPLAALEVAARLSAPSRGNPPRAGEGGCP